MFCYTEFNQGDLLKAGSDHMGLASMVRGHVLAARLAIPVKMLKLPAASRGESDPWKENGLLLNCSLTPQHAARNALAGVFKADSGDAVGLLRFQVRMLFMEASS
jgi:hypothetical protein